MNELKRLNERIDLKIARGHRYTKDAQRHLALIRLIAKHENN